MTPSPALFNSIEDLVLHRPPMLLLESVVAWDSLGLTAIVSLRDSALFADSNGNIPSWVGVEYMAQAISAFAGITAKLNRQPISLGFLLGTRSYSSRVSHFKPEQKITVSVRQLLRDETNLVLFDGKIYADSELCATAEIKAIQPDDVNAVLLQFEQMIESTGAKNDSKKNFSNRL
jgi:predicted hotdog family 3-hydroxylacyl-ACP dehydratase